MRAGRLDREIQIQSFGNTVEPDGTPVEHWALVATVRAQLVQMSTEEYLRAYGETEALAVIFRTRWLDGVTTQHRVVYGGRNLDIREVKEIGRRRGLELRCEEVRP
jgi:SPP1 family predicted phage head-tail adaptor